MAALASPIANGDYPRIEPAENAIFMSAAEPLFESRVPGLPMIGRGKVRDIYSVDDNHLLIVTTDRLSAYDVVLPDPVPMKGQVLTQISLFWFRMMADIIDNQLTELAVSDVVADSDTAGALRDRALVVKRLKPLPIEAVVRGYLIGSGWRDYQQFGQVCGVDLPPGLEQAEQRRSDPPAAISRDPRARPWWRSAHRSCPRRGAALRTAR